MKEIIVYDNAWQKQFYEDPIGTIGILAPIIPWFITLLTFMLVVAGGEKLDNFLYKKGRERQWTIKIYYLIGVVLVFISFNASYFYVWGF